MGPYQIQVPDVAALTRKGYAVVSLNYRLLRRPGDAFIDYALPAVQDGKAALRFLRANAAKYGLDPEKFAVWGNSAGGFIAAMLALTGHGPTVFDDPALGNSDISSAAQAAVIWHGPSRSCRSKLTLAVLNEQAESAKPIYFCVRFTLDFPEPALSFTVVRIIPDASLVVLKTPDVSLAVL